MAQTKQLIDTDADLPEDVRQKVREIRREASDVIPDERIRERVVERLDHLPEDCKGVGNPCLGEDSVKHPTDFEDFTDRAFELDRVRRIVFTRTDDPVRSEDPTGKNCAIWLQDETGSTSRISVQCGSEKGLEGWNSDMWEPILSDAEN